MDGTGTPRIITGSTSCVIAMEYHGQTSGHGVGVPCDLFGALLLRRLLFTSRQLCCTVLYGASYYATSTNENGGTIVA